MYTKVALQIFCATLAANKLKGGCLFLQTQLHFTDITFEILSHSIPPCPLDQAGQTGGPQATYDPHEPHPPQYITIHHNMAHDAIEFDTPALDYTYSFSKNCK